MPWALALGLSRLILGLHPSDDIAHETQLHLAYDACFYFGDRHPTLIVRLVGQEMAQS